MVAGLPQAPILRFGFPGRCVCAHGCVLSHFSRVQLFVTLRTVACQAPLSTGFSGQEYWSGLPFPSPGDLSDPGIELVSPEAPALPVDSTAEPPGKPSQVDKFV